MTVQSLRSVLGEHSVVLLALAVLATIPIAMLITGTIGRASHGRPVLTVALVAASPAKVKVTEVPVTGDEVLERPDAGAGAVDTRAVARAGGSGSSQRVLTSNPNR